MKTDEPTAAPAASSEFELVTLDTPLKRGETEITSVQLRKPRAGELRGLQLQSLVQGDVISMIALVPRISNPPLLPHEVEGLCPEDIGAMTGIVMGFFMSKKDRAEMGRILGLTDQKEPPKS